MGGNDEGIAGLGIGDSYIHHPLQMCHSERSEEPDNESIAIGLHGFFATLRMTHLQGLSA